MKDDADRVTQAGADAADPMAEIDAVDAFRPLDRPVVHGERDRIALPQRHDLGAALHARALLRENEFATREVLFWFGEQDRDLKRKREVAVQVLVQAVSPGTYWSSSGVGRV